MQVEKHQQNHIKMSNLYTYLSPAIIFTTCFIEILAEPRQCDNGTECPGSMYCCSSGCCYQDTDHVGFHEGYRMTIWNMWYFWFVVIFVLMACFSGCGYYKQRQRLLQSHHSGAPGFGFFSVFQMQTNPRYHSDVTSTRTNNTDVERQPVQPQVAANQIGFWSLFRVPTRHRPGSTGVVTLETGYQDNLDLTHSPPGATLQPPPYSEVVNNPDLFPSSTKTSAPPYKQQSNVTDSGSRNRISSENAPQPPPYSEVADHSTARATASI